MNSLSDGGPTSFSPSSSLSPSNTLISDMAGSLPDPTLLSNQTASLHSQTKQYEYAWSDFFPSKACCIYKSGKAWDVRHGPEEQGLIREARPICRPDIALVWPTTIPKIITCLDNAGVNFTCINPFGWANRGEKTLLCDFVLSVGIIPDSLEYDLALSTAINLKEILTSINLSEAEVAFVEMVLHDQAGGPPLFSVNPPTDVSTYRKQFSALLGVPIGTDYAESTGALYIKLDSAEEDMALLTCAHVIRPHTAFSDNDGMVFTNQSQHKQHVFAPGNASYSIAAEKMTAEFLGFDLAINFYEQELNKINLSPMKLAEYAEALAPLRVKRHNLNAFRSEVRSDRSTPEQRTLGHAMLSSPIKVNVNPNNGLFGWTEDWALISVDPEMIDMATFQGNKLYFGASSLHLVTPIPNFYRPYFPTHISAMLTVH